MLYYYGSPTTPTSGTTKSDGNYYRIITKFVVIF